MSNIMSPVHAVLPPADHSPAENAFPLPPSTKPLAARSVADKPSLDIPDCARTAELPQAILEEDEESASELLEPITPTSEFHPHALHQPVVASSDQGAHEEPPLHKPALTSTEATPPQPLQSKPAPTAANPSANPTSKTKHKPSPLRHASRSIKSLFRRSSHHSSDEQIGQPMNDASPTDRNNSSSSSSSNNNIINHNVNTRGGSPSPREGSVSSGPQVSPTVSNSNSPSSPSSPSSTINGQNSLLTPDGYFLDKKPSRSSTGLSLRNRSRVMFGSTPRPSREEEARIRSPSLSDVRDQPQRPGFSIPAVAGAGLKARRMSASLPDDFSVDVCELSDEFVSTSKVPGRRGKEIGKGATATVKIMCRKGSRKGERFAVKEFRKRGSKENADEYEKKVKSEFSIANSIVHPNIVETFRLCTHNGRWNHVMEFCSYGELFSLVQRGYLQPRDNLCFFKQVIRGVGYLHENGIAHRDIKLENLLLSDEGHIKITDFGVSEVFSGLHPGVRSANGQCGKDMGEVRLSPPGICGSLPYIAPEVLAKNGNYDPRPLDVWSCAIVYLTLHYKGNLWPSAETQHVNYSKFINGWNKFLTQNPDTPVSETSRPKCGPAFSLLANSGMRLLLLRMLHPDPAKRITVPEILKDRYFKIIECCSPDLEREPEKTVKSIDAACSSSHKLASKMVVQKIHHHFPPEKKYLPQHRFDMGEGY